MIDQLLNQSPEDLNKLDSTIKELLPLAKDKLHLLESKESIWRKKHNLSDEDIILYSALKTQDNKKVIVCVLGCEVASDSFSVNGKTFPAESLIVKAEIGTWDFFEFVESATKNGVQSIIEKFI